MSSMGKLYLVGTPIGNLEDLSPRAGRILGEVDFIAAEDTRVTAKLLSHLGLRQPMISYFEHNKRERGLSIIQRLESGETCALVTDAGMPCLSDPGEDLAALCAEHGVPMEVVPGPSAAIAALCLSGLPSGRFSFEGFLSVKRSSREAHLQEIRTDRRTLIFYEAPHKLPSTLEDLARVLGPRRAAVAKELTKIHETVYRATLPEAAAYFRENTPRGEYVIVVEGAPTAPEEKCPLEDAVAQALALASAGTPLSQAARETAAQTGWAKNELYARALEVRDAHKKNPSSR